MLLSPNDETGLLISKRQPGAMFLERWVEFSVKLTCTTCRPCPKLSLKTRLLGYWVYLVALLKCPNPRQLKCEMFVKRCKMLLSLNDETGLLISKRQPGAMFLERWVEFSLKLTCTTCRPSPRLSLKTRRLGYWVYLVALLKCPNQSLVRF